MECEWSYLSSDTGYYAKNMEIGLTQFDSVLGHIPKPKFLSKTLPDWTLGEVSIDQEGLRQNGNSLNTTHEARILAVGDSFTFGYQVSDSETWPSCVERTLNVPVSNGGVFGYGAAQSVLRAEILSRDRYFDVLLLGVLLGHDFPRDQLFFRSGFSKPAVIASGEKIQFSTPVSLSEYMDKENSILTALGWLRNHSYVANDVFDFLKITPAAPRMSQRHPSAASVPEIIKFSLERFSAIKGSKKVVVLLYTEPDAYSRPESVQTELAIIISEAKRMNLRVIDTLDYLKRYPASKVWSGHYTPLGNQLVCDAVVSDLTLEHTRPSWSKPGIKPGIN